VPAKGAAEYWLSPVLRVTVEAAVAVGLAAVAVTVHVAPTVEDANAAPLLLT